MSTNYLHALSTKHLLSMLRHIQLGNDHLSKILSRTEYRNLLSMGSLSNQQVTKMKSDSQEKLGNVSVVVNTILTSFFGAWLGFNGFSHSTISFGFGALIITFALLFGFSIGYLSYLLTHHQAKLALKKQQLLNIEELILEIVINKRKEKIKSIQDKTQSLLFDLGIPKNNNPHNLAQDILENMEKLDQLSTKVTFYSLIKTNIGRIKKNIHKLLKHNSDKKQTHTSDLTEGQFLMNNALTNASYIKTLTKVDITSKIQVPKLHTWLFKNTTSILVGLVPTFVGTFASMFVFLNGFPAFFSGINIHFGIPEAYIPFLRNLAIGLAFIISLYFAYSHLHSNYKAFKRTKQLENTDKKLAEKNNLVLQLMTQSINWNHVYHHLLLIKEFYEYEIKDNHPVELTS